MLLGFASLPVALQMPAASGQIGFSPRQPSSSLPDAPAVQSNSTSTDLRELPKAILKDQAHVWTSPAHLRPHDLIWLVPLAAATGATIATDHRAMSTLVSQNPGFNQSNINVSNALIYSFVAVPAGLYGVGYLDKDQHAKETGFLGAQALGDGVILEQGLKLVFWRERPSQDSERGRFFQGSAGVDSSFPSSHSVLAWSSAAVIAEEYPSRWTQAGVYTLATGVSLTRVLGQQHFPTDVLVGSAAGWLLGHYVARAHHKRR